MLLMVLSQHSTARDGWDEDEEVGWIRREESDGPCVWRRWVPTGADPPGCPGGSARGDALTAHQGATELHLESYFHYEDISNMSGC